MQGLNGFQIDDIFFPPINAFHFSNGNDGYVVGEQGFIRHTSDAGFSWQVVWPKMNGGKPQIMTSVWAYDNGKAIIAGPSGYLQLLENNQLKKNISLPSGPDFTSFSFPPANHTNGFLAGKNGVLYKMSRNTTGFILSKINTSVLASFQVKSMLAISPSQVFLAGTQGKIYYLIGTKFFSLPLSTTLGNADFYTLDLKDAKNAYAAGDQGKMIKIFSNTDFSKLKNIQGITFSSCNLADNWVPLQNNSANKKINTLQYMGNSKVFVGGDYFSTIPSANSFARIIEDESMLYSSRYWYDQLGRLVLSQNTKQANASPLKFTYQLYDAEGRHIEYGEKAENKLNIKFENIFGAYVNGFFNIK